MASATPIRGKDAAARASAATAALIINLGLTPPATVTSAPMVDAPQTAMVAGEGKDEEEEEEAESESESDDDEEEAPACPAASAAVLSEEEERDTDEALSEPEPEPEPRATANKTKSSWRRRMALRACPERRCCVVASITCSSGGVGAEAEAWYVT